MYDAQRLWKNRDHFHSYYTYNIHQWKQRIELYDKSIHSAIAKLKPAEISMLNITWTFRRGAISRLRSGRANRIRANKTVHTRPQLIVRSLSNADGDLSTDKGWLTDQSEMIIKLYENPIHFFKRSLQNQTYRLKCRLVDFSVSEIEVTIIYMRLQSSYFRDLFWNFEKNGFQQWVKFSFPLRSLRRVSMTRILSTTTSVRQTINSTSTPPWVFLNFHSSILVRKLVFVRFQSEETSIGRWTASGDAIMLEYRVETFSSSCEKFSHRKFHNKFSPKRL